MAALLRDFSARNVTWFIRVHRLLDPTVDEIAAREGVYLAVLQTGPSASVGLAQEKLGRLASTQMAEPEALVAASGVVLLRTEKKVIKAQLALLRLVVDARADLTAEVEQLVAGATAGLSPDVAAIAQRLFPSLAAPRRREAAAEDATWDRAIVVPGPRTADLARPAGPDPINDEAECLGLVAGLLEGRGDGRDLWRIADWFRHHRPDTDVTALVERGRAVLQGIYDPLDASPRGQLASLLSVWSGGEPLRPDFAGYHEYGSFRVYEEVPKGYQVKDSSMSMYRVVDGREEVLERHNFRSGYRRLETHSPIALFCTTMKNARLSLKSKRSSLGTIQPPGPAVVDWERVVCEGGPGTYGVDQVIGTGVRPFFRHAGPLTPPTLADNVSLDVADVPREFTHRVTLARETDGFDLLVEWMAELYRDNPDTFAAQAHPWLWAATAVVNVRGVAPVLAALGSSWRVLRAPGLSALALGLSAKQADHRAAAAEAVGELASRNLLDPEAFAVQVSAHLMDGFVQAGRVADALRDAAVISPPAGYRVLQTVTAILPALDGVTGAHKLVVLLGDLAEAYGTPVEVPAVLAPRAKGRSVLALALQRLPAVRPRPTQLVVATAAAIGARGLVAN